MNWTSFASKVIEAMEAGETLHWCQGCGRLVEEQWMTWTNGLFRCLTCAGGPSVPEECTPWGMHVLLSERITRGQAWYQVDYVGAQ
ncbi:hypothetical protein MINTMi27_15450 [Mycobacterium intracellulare]|nr:hypothetical protein MINTMi27_15450 [Mycobacterium intracellulare]